MIGPPVQPIVRELGCSKCKLRTVERMAEDNSFKKLPEKCPRCGRTNCFGVLRIFSHLQNN